MSAHASLMEREYSVPSLSSRGNSELGSRYVVESGFYMTSFAATIFIGALVTVGVLLITLLIALAVMLQSCESRSGGVVEIRMSNSDYDNCKIFSLHAELNNLGAGDLPSTCRSFSADQTNGQYERDLNVSLWLVERYIDSVQPSDDDVILMDIDDTFPSDPHYSEFMRNRFYQYDCRDCLKEAKDSKQILLLRLYRMLRASNWSVIFLSRKPEKQRNATMQHLLSAGYGSSFSLILRLDDEMEMDAQQYFAKRRLLLQSEGFQISGIISRQMDALTGPYLGKRVFKLPNPMYYYPMNHRRNTYISE